MKYLCCTITLASLGTCTALAQPAGIFFTPRAGEVRDTSLYGLSADGRIAAGHTSIIRGAESSLVLSVFTPPALLEYRVTPFTAPPLFAAGMSDDGGTIAGFARFPDRPFNPEPAVASVAHGLQLMGRPPGHELGEALGVSGDGNVVVGYGQRGSGGGEYVEGFRWTRAGGYEMLAQPRPESFWTIAHAASRDGSIIVGESNTVFGTVDGVVWMRDQGVRLLPGLPVPFSDTVQALGVSGDGTFIAGATTGATGGIHPVLWGPDGVLDLGLIGPYRHGLANDVSNDGLVAALRFYQPPLGAGVPDPVAAIWTQATGTLLLTDYLLQNGISVPAGVTLIGSEALSDDGRTIAGNARYFDAELGRDVTVGFVATVPSPGALALAATALLAYPRRRSPSK